MKCVIFILHQTEKLEALLYMLSKVQISGATIMESTGMAQTLFNSKNGAILDSLQFLLHPTNEENHTILMVLKEDQVPIAKQAIRDVIGDLSQPNTGILFTLPIEEVEGLRL